MLYPGNIAVRMPIPNQLSLLGKYYVQVAALNGGTISSLTNGLEIVVGPKP